MSLLESGEMYLETILILSKEKPLVRSIDVANYMNYSKPSVSRAVGLLKDGGYLVVTEDGGLHLTEAGLEIGETILERHMMLARFLMNLGVDEETAVADACRIEHVISPVSFEAIKRHVIEISEEK